MSDVVASSKLCDVRAGFGTAAASMIGMLPAYVSPRPEVTLASCFPIRRRWQGKGTRYHGSLCIFSHFVNNPSIELNGFLMLFKTLKDSQWSNTTEPSRCAQVPAMCDRGPQCLRIRLTSAHAHFGGIRGLSVAASWYLGRGAGVQ